MSQQTKQHAVSPLRSEDFPEWYQQAVKLSDLAENSPVRGSMVIKPWGYSLWERIQADLDAEIKKTGHVNAYFPLFIPLSYLQREADHVEGFAKECAVVTHHRLETREGQLVPSGKLEEPLVVRPTSEIIIGECYSKWVSSYRDLPLLINQWANVVRWEMRPRIFLRTTEFLWQEGHTVHATEEEALEESLKMLKVYRRFVEETLAIPVLVGEKSPGERFPGAEKTFTIEMMMQDRKALQGGTSHYLGQNFAKASKIRFTDRDGLLKFAYTTSWGVTTRLIGAMIMAHGDDNGIRLPPRLAPYQVVVVPVVPKEEMRESILSAADELASRLRLEQYAEKPLRVHVDRRELRAGEKNWEWIKKGVPVRLELGPKDLERGSAVLYRRDREPKEKLFLQLDELSSQLPSILEEIQAGYFSQALSYRDRHLVSNLETFEELRDFFTPKDLEKPEIHGGFVKAKWCGDPKSEELLKELQVTIRCLPLEQSGSEGICILTGRPARLDAYFAKAY